MPGKKKKKAQNEKDENSPLSPTDTNQRLHQPYEGYDEEKTNNDCHGDYDIDENNIRERSGEYQDWNRDDKPDQ